MTLRQLWIDLRLRVRELQSLKIGSDAYSHLVDSGISECYLREFIRLGRPRKISTQEKTQAETDRDVATLLDMGGHVAGGRAISEFFGRPSAGDSDVFFNDFATYVRAHLMMLNNPSVDVCLFRDEPWEMFDIAASRCSYSASGFHNSDSFESAFKSGVSSIHMDCIIHPGNTLKRVVKYGSRYNLKFPTPDLIMISVSSKEDCDLVSQAMCFADKV